MDTNINIEHHNDSSNDDLITTPSATGFVALWITVSVATWSLFSTYAPVSAGELTTVRASALPLRQDISLQRVGSGSLSWFGVSIYEASLWTHDGTFGNLHESLPAALHITYQREFTNKALAKRTTQEWNQLDIYSPVQRKLWQRRLESIWPNVIPGDSITTLVTGDKKTHFYHNRQLIGVIHDASFGAALLSIWLDVNTSEPTLRRQLLGHKEE
ncbi:MAG: chalcone isomerase family protein [Gammaproteobacteria bacterium]|jgi:hypothetical protein